MIFVSGEHIADVNQLSDDFHGVLSLIKDGERWLEWALTNPGLTVYHSSSEQDLLRKIQAGLHETLDFRFPSFTLHIDKILATNEADLPVLVKGLSSDEWETSELNSIKEKYQLVENQQLVSADAFRKRFDLPLNPVFLNPGFSDLLSLYHLQKTTKVSALAREGFAFGLKKAATLTEFIHYSRFYFNCVSSQFKGRITAKARPHLVEEIYQRLSEVSYPLIYLTNINSIDSQGDLSSRLNALMKNSDFIGYKLIPQALENLVLNIEVNGLGQMDITSNIEKYMKSITEQGAKADFKQDTPSQDGKGISLRAQLKDFELIVNIDSGGNVSLSENSRPTIVKHQNEQP